MKKKPSIQSLLNTTLLLAVYACFFAVQLSFSIDAINNSKGSFYLHHSESEYQKSGNSNTATIRQTHGADSKKINIRLNKRFQASWAPAILSNEIVIAPILTCEEIAYGKYQTKLLSSFTNTRAFRGPPAVVMI